MARPVRVRVDQIFDFIEQPNADDRCRHWLGKVNKAGYGVVLQHNHTYYVHRLAYEWLHGPVAAGVVIRHSCDNPPCANPLHLLAGTTADNVKDMMDRGRHASVTKPGYAVRGSRHGRSRLTEDQVRQIRTEYGGFRKHPNLSELAAKFGVTKDMVSNIIRRDNWKHI